MPKKCNKSDDAHSTFHSTCRCITFHIQLFIPPAVALHSTFNFSFHLPLHCIPRSTFHSTCRCITFHVQLFIPPAVALHSTFNFSFNLPLHCIPRFRPRQNVCLDTCRIFTSKGEGILLHLPLHFLQFLALYSSRGILCTYHRPHRPRRHQQQQQQQPAALFDFSWLLYDQRLNPIVSRMYRPTLACCFTLPCLHFVSFSLRFFKR